MKCHVPVNLVARIQRDVPQILATPDTRNRLVDMGVDHRRQITGRIRRLSCAPKRSATPK
jgi:hypothetical protein